MAINKVVYDGTTLLDLSVDTLASADQLVQGIVAHDRTGATIVGMIINGDNLGYGLTDGTLPIVGIGQVGYAHAWDDQYQSMVLGQGQIGTARVM